MLKSETASRVLRAHATHSPGVGTAPYNLSRRHFRLLEAIFGDSLCLPTEAPEPDRAIHGLLRALTACWSPPAGQAIAPASGTEDGSVRRDRRRDSG